LHRLFGITAQWIQTAKEKYNEAGDNFGWDWSETSNGPAFSVNSPKLVNCGFIKSIVDSDETDNLKAP
jgi:hypothetical protein